MAHRTRQRITARAVSKGCEEGVDWGQQLGQQEGGQTSVGQAGAPPDQPWRALKRRCTLLIT